MSVQELTLCTIDIGTMGCDFKEDIVYVIRILRVTGEKTAPKSYYKVRIHSEEQMAIDVWEFKKVMNSDIYAIPVPVEEWTNKYLIGEVKRTVERVLYTIFSRSKVMILSVSKPEGHGIEYVCNDIEKLIEEKFNDRVQRPYEWEYDKEWKTLTEAVRDILSERNGTEMLNLEETFGENSLGNR